MAINERKLTKSELDKREDVIMNMKKNKRDLVKKYGKDAEKVMYGRATNIAKGKKDPKLTELIKDALKNPKKADLNKDGKLSDYEEKRGAAIEKSMAKEGKKEKPLSKPVAKDLGKMKTNFNDLKKRLKLEDTVEENSTDVIDPAEYGDIGSAYLKGFNKPHSLDLDQLEKLGRAIVKQLYKGDFKAAKAKFLNSEDLSEDLDLGHQDNEPHMLKADLYRIGKYAMELYQMVDQFEYGMGEVDFPSWWQSKIFKAKDALVGAKHYLDFEINEPKIDAVVDVATDVVDEEIGQLGTDGDTGFQASLYTPNEMGAASVGREYASGAFEGIAKKLAKQIKETIDGGQIFDYFANKGYTVKERRPDGYPKKEGVVGYQVTDRPDSGRRSDNPQTVIFQHNPSTDQFTISQMNGYKIDQKDAVKAGMREKGSSWVAGIDSYITDGNYNPVDISAEGLKDIVDHVMGGLSREAKAQADYYKDRGPTSGTIDEKMAKDLKEKGMPGDPERFVGSGGDEVDSDSNINVTTDNPAQDAEIGFGLEEEKKKKVVNTVLKQLKK